MFQLFDIDSPIMHFLEKLGDTLILSLLWLGCSLPLVTIGASTTALYYATIKSICGEGAVWKDFFYSFRQNFKQSLSLTLLGSAIFALLYVDLRFLTVGYLRSVQVFVGMAGFLTMAILSYAHPLLAWFEWTVGELLKTSVLLSVANLPKTVMIVVMNAAPMLLLLWQTDWFIRLIPLWICLWTGGIARLNSHMFLKMFEKITPKQNDE